MTNNTENVISTTGLTKRFGDVLAVDDLSLKIRCGEIYGFLGLNGAGKTTTIRMLLGMIRPTSGSVEIFGQPVHPTSNEIWSRVGYMVDVPAAYPELTLRQNLEIARRLHQIDDLKSVDRIMKALDIEQYAMRCAGKLSHGNKQRLGLAKAMLHQPELLILDEPANGLDPAGIVEIREMLRELCRRQGTTILMSSHILDEVSRLATRIGIIHQGRLIEELDADRLERQLRPRLLVDARDRQSARQALTAGGFSVRAGDNGALEMEDERAVEHPDEIAGLLVRAGTPPTLLLVRQDSLETHFLKLVEMNGEER